MAIARQSLRDRADDADARPPIVGPGANEGPAVRSSVGSPICSCQRETGNCPLVSLTWGCILEPHDPDVSRGSVAGQPVFVSRSSLHVLSFLVSRSPASSRLKVWLPGMDSNQGLRYDAFVGEL